jgi:hypothetical protein
MTQAGRASANNPIAGIAVCPARAAIDQAAVPPASAMNFRRLMRYLIRVGQPLLAVRYIIHLRLKSIPGHLCGRFGSQAVDADRTGDVRFTCGS